MFIIAQIPFVDIRLLSNKNYKNCFFPNMFDRHYEKATYYRFLGSERNRFNPNGLPAAERTYFDSRKMIYVDHKSKMKSYHYFPQVLFARFFVEKQCFHFDIGLRETINFSGPQRKNISKFARDLLQIPFLGINDRFEQGDDIYSILGLERPLKNIYLYATSSKKAERIKDYSSKLIWGYPALFIVYDKNEQHYFGMAKTFNVNKNIKIRHELLSLKNTFADAWYIGKEGISRYNQDLRNLRIYLSKLHSYKESARIILNYLDKHGFENFDKQKVKEFLKLMQFQMNRETFYGYDNKDFRQLAFYIDERYNHVTWDEFKFRIQAKIEELERSIMSTYNFNSADNSQQVNVVNSPGAIVEIPKNTEEVRNEYIQKFNSMFEELLMQNKNLLEEERITLENKKENFLACTQNTAIEVKEAKKRLEILKSTLSKISSFAITNPEKIEKLMSIGEKILDFFSK